MKTFEITYTYGKLDIEVTVTVEHESEMGARLFVKNQGAKKILKVEEKNKELTDLLTIEELREKLSEILKNFVGGEDCVENLFTELYIAAGYPKGCYEDVFSDMFEFQAPPDDEIIDYFIK